MYLTLSKVDIPMYLTLSKVDLLSTGLCYYNLSIYGFMIYEHASIRSLYAVVYGITRRLSVGRRWSPVVMTTVLEITIGSCSHWYCTILGHLVHLSFVFPMWIGILRPALI